MAKKVVSVALRRKKPISKRKNLKLALRKIFNYLKSDTYMFAPLLHPQPYPIPDPASLRGEVFCEPINKKETKLGEDVGDYLKCDCYMYAPLIMDSAGGKAETGNVCDQMGPTTKETRGQEGKTLDGNAKNNDTNNPSRRIVMKHNLLQKETVKHIVQQTCRTSSSPGEVLLQSEKRKIVATKSPAQ